MASRFVSKALTSGTHILRGKTDVKVVGQAGGHKGIVVVVSKRSNRTVDVPTCPGLRTDQTRNHEGKANGRAEEWWSCRCYSFAAARRPAVVTSQKVVAAQA
jgi:hypothetical protein